MEIQTFYSPPALREALRFARARPSISAGLRAGFLTTLPLLLSPYVQHTTLAFIGLSGFGTTLVDKGGGYRTRFWSMSAYGVLGALAVFSGTALAPYPWFATPFLFLVLLACGYVRVLGAEASSVGLFVGVDLVISLSRPLPSLVASLSAAALFLLGNVWAQALTLWVWPLRPYRPARLALAQALEALSRVASSLVAASPSAEGQRVRRAQFAQCRSAIEAARAALDSSRRGRPGPTARAERLLLAVEDADLLFGALIAVEDDLIGIGDPRIAADIDRFADCAHMQLAVLADGVLREVVPDTISPAAVPPDGASHHSAAAPPSTRARHLKRAEDQLAQLRLGVQRLDDRVLGSAAPRSPTLYGVEPADFAARLRDHLTLESAFMRHALRASVAAVVAYVLSESLSFSHGFWATLTCYVIMQPQSSATTAKAVQRVLGTLLGAGLALIIASYTTSLLALAGWVFLFVAVAVALLPLNYGAYAVFLTPGFILLAEHAAGDASLAKIRVINTLVGSGLALVCSRLLFPLAERDQFRPLMGTALEAISDLTLTASTATLDPISLHRGRRIVGLALLNAEASHQRMLAEGRLSSREGEALLTMLLYAHRFTAGLTGIDDVADDTRADLRSAAPALAIELRGLANVVRGRTSRASLPPPDAESERTSEGAQGRVDQLRSQLRVLAHAVVRFSRGPRGLSAV